jgi:hypothetical protein
MILCKVSLSLDSELASSMTRLGSNFLSPAESIGATGLPTRTQRHDCNIQREQALAGVKGLGPGVAPFSAANRLAFSPRG